jgi:hypothetical protein
MGTTGCMGDEHETTRELRVRQGEREATDRRLAEQAASEDEAEKYARRAERDAYLRERLEKRAEAETDAYVREHIRKDAVGRRGHGRVRKLFSSRGGPRAA